MKKIKKIFFGLYKRLSSFLTRLGFSRQVFGVGSIYDFFIKLFWPYPKIVEVQGSKMWVDPKGAHSGILRTLEAYAKNLVHEKSTTKLFKKIIKEGDVVVDVGANIGYFTLLAARLVGPKGKVFSFEPEPLNFRYLTKNIELNNYSQVFAYQMAVSNKNGKTKLYLCDYDSGHHTINKYEGVKAYSRGRPTRKHSVEIETVVLDDFLKEKTNHIDVVKIDVEGAELLVIKGMEEILKKNRNIKILLEFFPLLLRKMESSPEELIKMLSQKYDFNIFIVGSDYTMKGLSKGLIKVNNFKEIVELLKEKSAHVNLYLRR